ncbi:MAG: hypothetical protein ABMA00_07625 [Gemmatimonas sp.]
MRLLTWLFFATLSLILMLQLRGFDATLRTADTPGGIVGYELAGTAARSNTYLDAWRSANALDTAKVSLGVDFAFLLAYPLMFAIGTTLLVRRPPSGLFDRVGAVMPYAVLLCIPLDATENLALWRMIDHGATDTLARLAAICAVLKFLLVIAATLWCIAALFRRFMPRSPTPVG